MVDIGSHLHNNDKHCGYEFITSDDKWWVFHRWDGPICRTKLLEKEDTTFEEAVQWMLEDMKRLEPKVP